jgi:hypothetical protein
MYLSSLGVFIRADSGAVDTFSIWLACMYL